jgi:hypothetical protein
MEDPHIPFMTNMLSPSLCNADDNISRLMTFLKENRGSDDILTLENHLRITIPEHHETPMTISPGLIYPFALTQFDQMTLTTPTEMQFSLLPTKSESPKSEYKSSPEQTPSFITKKRQSKSTAPPPGVSPQKWNRTLRNRERARQSRDRRLQEMEDLFNRNLELEEMVAKITPQLETLQTCACSCR